MATNNSHTNANTNSNANLLQLVMIVKDATVSIERTLKSYIPYISYWCILDTGSTDGTQDIIRRTLKDIPGDLYEEPFIDFTPSRNRALDLACITPSERPSKCEVRCTFSIMPDDTYILNGGDKLMEILKIAATRDENALSIQIRDNVNIYQSKRITKVASGLRYFGHIHEDIDLKGQPHTPIFDNTIFLHDIEYPEMIKRTAARLEKDVHKLKKWINDEPNEPRPHFYLGATYYVLNDYKNALVYYNSRLAFVDTYAEERLEAYMRAGYIHFKLNNNVEDAVHYFNRGAAEFPSRAAEALYLAAITYKEVANNTTDANKKFFYEKMYYMYLRHACIYEVPLQYTLFVNSDTYNLRIPYECAFEALKVGEFDIAAQQIQRALHHNPNNPDVNTLARTIDVTMRANSIPIVPPEKIIKHKSKVVVFVTGPYYTSWNSDTKELGGSETMLALQAEQMAANGYETYAFIHCDQPDQKYIRGVFYRHFNDFMKFAAEHHIDHCIVSRHTEFLLYTRRPNILNVYLWAHDVLPLGTPICDNRNFRSFIALSLWQQGLINSTLSVPLNLIYILPNAIDTNRFTQVKKPLSKIPMSFIFSSSADRDLENLLEIFPAIKKEFPAAHLIVYTDINRSYVNPGGLYANQPERYIKLTKLISASRHCVTIKPRIDQAELAKKFLETEFWIYPNRVFTETYCITALEAQAAGCICISSDLGALATTVGQRGITFPIEKATAEHIISRLKGLTPEQKRKYIKAGSTYAREHDITIIGKQLSNFLKSFEGH